MCANSQSQWRVWSSHSLLRSNESQPQSITHQSAVSPGVPACAGHSLPTGGGLGAHSASQRTCHRRRRPWRVLSATCTPGSPSEVQNHQRQEGHGQRHVSHLLPSSGERGWQEGEGGLKELNHYYRKQQFITNCTILSIKTLGIVSSSFLQAACMFMLDLNYSIQMQSVSLDISVFRLLNTTLL